MCNLLFKAYLNGVADCDSSLPDLLADFNFACFFVANLPRGCENLTIWSKVQDVIFHHGYDKLSESCVVMPQVAAWVLKIGAVYQFISKLQFLDLLGKPGVAKVFLDSININFSDLRLLNSYPGFADKGLISHVFTMVHYEASILMKLLTDNTFVNWLSKKDMIEVVRAYLDNSKVRTYDEFEKDYNCARLCLLKLATMAEPNELLELHKLLKDFRTAALAELHNKVSVLEITHRDRAIKMLNAALKKSLFNEPIENGNFLALAKPNKTLTHILATQCIEKWIEQQTDALADEKALDHPLWFAAWRQSR